MSITTTVSAFSKIGFTSASRTSISGIIAILGTAIALEFPFMNTALYVGPISKYLGDADFAWLVGLIISAVLYYFPMKMKIHFLQNHLPM